MHHVRLLPLLLLGATVVAALPRCAGAAIERPALDLATGRLRADGATQGAPFTVISASDPKEAASAGGSFTATVSDYLYRGGTILDPTDYIFALFYTYNHYIASRLYVTAGIGFDYAAYAGHKKVVGGARTAGLGFRIADTQRMTLEAQLRWTKYTTPGEHLGGLTPMVRLRWQPGR